MRLAQDLIAPPASHSTIVKTWLVQNGVRPQNIVDRRDNIQVLACELFPASSSHTPNA
jgi:hypothetical protein